MSYYRTHLFFCTNQRTNGKKCCADAGAQEIREYTKKTINQQGLGGPDGIRVNAAGCLGRCALGPCMVVYPEGTWYTYKSKGDIDEIIEKHLLAGQPVPRLLIDEQVD